MTILPVSDHVGCKSSEFVDVYEMRKKLREFINSHKEDYFPHIKFRIAICDSKVLRIRLIHGPFKFFDGNDKWGHKMPSQDATIVIARIRDFLADYLIVEKSPLNGYNTVNFDADIEAGRWDKPYKIVKK